MVMIADADNVPKYSISSKTYELLQRVHEKIHKEDSMFLCIFWGQVGCGKSLNAQKWGFAVDETLNIDKVCFNKEEFIHAVLDSRKQCVIGDEGISIFFSRGAMTKEGRLMAELMAQCRQKNLLVIICIPDILAIDNLVLSAANLVAYVWEDKKQIGDSIVTIKGNMAIYPQMKGNSFKERIIQYLRIKKANPLAKIKRPEPFLLEPGGAIGDNYQKPWYPVGEEAYRFKKESILAKYRTVITHKEYNKNIDYNLMDSLLQAKAKRYVIAEKLNVSLETVTLRKNLLKKWGKL